MAYSCSCHVHVHGGFVSFSWSLRLSYLSFVCCLWVGVSPDIEECADDGGR